MSSSMNPRPIDPVGVSAKQLPLRPDRFRPPHGLLGVARSSPAPEFSEAPTGFPVSEM